MSLSQEQVKNISHLSRIAASDDDLARLGQDLNNILTFIEQMQAVDTTDVEPLSHPHDMHQRLREDTPNADIERARYQAIAPLTEAGLYLVPTVIE
jgi:aspartyl-tRNA(Asn)/glutamyl-tRNA(Gln) amidotransferase subunit C